jgi:hypothetical protein
MNIGQIYAIYINKVKHYVYDGTCDGYPTKWITSNMWDYTIKVKQEAGELVYYDGYNNIMYCFDDNDYQYELIRINSKLDSKLFL